MGLSEGGRLAALALAHGVVAEDSAARGVTQAVEYIRRLPEHRCIVDGVQVLVDRRQVALRNRFQGRFRWLQAFYLAQVLLRRQRPGPAPDLGQLNVP